MAWIRERRTRKGVVYFVEWRDPVTRAQRHQRIGYDRGLAEARRAVVEREAEGVTPAPAAATSVRAMLDLFLHSLELAGRRPGTVAFYRKHLEFLLRRWGDVAPERWTATMLEALIRERGWTPRRVRMVVATARPWIAWARAAGYVLPDFTTGIRRPKPRQERREALRPEQVAALLAVVRRRRCGLAVHLAACAGLSRGDVRALTWADVDLREGWIRTTRRKTGVPIVVPIVEPLRSLLVERRGLHGPVCRDLPADDSLLHAMLRRACRRAKIPPCGLHALRHAYATTLAANGVDLATIGRLLAHRPGSPVTMQYVHPDEARLRAAGDAIQSALTS